MKASELRIGNIINYTIYGEGYPEEGTAFLSEFEVSDFSGLDDISPIALTEEWLLKFGFISIDNFTFSFDEGYLTLSVENENWEDLCMDVSIQTADMNQPFYITAIQYVHQLQNLYFALTGKELQITETAQ